MGHFGLSEHSVPVQSEAIDLSLFQKCSSPMYLNIVYLLHLLHFLYGLSKRVPFLCGSFTPSDIFCSFLLFSFTPPFLSNIYVNTCYSSMFQVLIFPSLFHIFPGAISAHMTSFCCLIYLFFFNLTISCLYFENHRHHTSSRTLRANVCSIDLLRKVILLTHTLHLTFVQRVSSFFLPGCIFAYFSGWLFPDYSLSLYGCSLFWGAQPFARKLDEEDTTQA